MLKEKLSSIPNFIILIPTFTVFLEPSGPLGKPHDIEDCALEGFMIPKKLGKFLERFYNYYVCFLKYGYKEYYLRR